MTAHKHTAISMTLYPSKVWGQFVDGIYCNLKHTHLKIFFHHINNLHQNIKFTIWNESNGELAFLDTLLIRNNGKTSVLVDTKPKHTHKYLHYSSDHQTSFKESVVSCLFNRAYSIITNKDDFLKENTTINTMSKENGYQESIISKIFKIITKNHSLSQLQQQMQAIDNQEEEIRMGINLLCVEVTNEKLRRLLKSHKIRSIIYTESTFWKLL